MRRAFSCSVKEQLQQKKKIVIDERIHFFNFNYVCTLRIRNCNFSHLSPDAVFYFCLIYSINNQYTITIFVTNAT